MARLRMSSWADFIVWLHKRQVIRCQHQLLDLELDLKEQLQDDEDDQLACEHQMMVT